MKNLLLTAGLFLTFAGCKKNDNTSPDGDPFLGHWQADTIQESHVSPSGQVSGVSNSQQYISVLDATATSFDYTLYPKNKPGGGVPHFEYKRSGDTLKLTANKGIYTHILTRSLTRDSFTLETQMPDSPGPGTFIRLTYFHR